MLGASKVVEAGVVEARQREVGGQQEPMMQTWTAGLSRAKHRARLPEQPTRLPEQPASLAEQPTSLLLEQPTNLLEQPTSLLEQQTSLLEPMILLSRHLARLR